MVFSDDGRASTTISISSLKAEQHVVTEEIDLVIGIGSLDIGFLQKMKHPNFNCNMVWLIDSRSSGIPMATLCDQLYLYETDTDNKKYIKQFGM